MFEARQFVSDMLKKSIKGGKTENAPFTTTLANAIEPKKTLLTPDPVIENKPVQIEWDRSTEAIVDRLMTNPTPAIKALQEKRDNPQDIENRLDRGVSGLERTDRIKHYKDEVYQLKLSQLFLHEAGFYRHNPEVRITGVITSDMKPKDSQETAHYLKQLKSSLFAIKRSLFDKSLSRVRVKGQTPDQPVDMYVPTFVMSDEELKNNLSGLVETHSSMMVNSAPVTQEPVVTTNYDRALDDRLLAIFDKTIADVTANNLSWDEAMSQLIPNLSMLVLLHTDYSGFNLEYSM